MSQKLKIMKLEQTFTPKMKFILILIAIVALGRILFHPFNFTPIGAIALFAGTYITDKRKAFLVPLITLLISDLIIELTGGKGFYPDMIFVYGSFALITSIGFLLRGKEQRQTIMVASLVSSLLFFFVTNFGTWLMWDIYPKTGTGLLTCYIAGIPFFKGTVMGDLFYNIILFSSYAIARWRFPVLAR